MTDIEVREDRSSRREPRRGGRERGRGGKHDRRPPGGKFHDHVAPTAPIREVGTKERAPAPASPEAAMPERPAPAKPQQKRRAAPEKKPVDHSQLPAFLFRKIPDLNREPQK